jgi:hypothetical protein
MRGVVPFAILLGAVCLTCLSLRTTLNCFVASHSAVTEVTMSRDEFQVWECPSGCTVARSEYISQERVRLVLTRP